MNARGWVLWIVFLCACGGGHDDAAPDGGGDGDADADADADGDGDADGDLDCEAVTTSDDPAVQAYIDWVQETMTAEGIPGAAISILEGGDETQRILLGRKRAGACGAITSDTRFLGGHTVTPMVLGLAIASAHEDGTLDIDGPVDAHVDVAPPGITFRELLENRSGLPPVQLNDPEDCVGLQDYFEDHVGEEPWFEHGAYQQVSISEASLAGLALGIADGGDFATSIQDRVLGPLEMSATFDLAEALSGDFASGSPEEILNDCEVAAPARGLFVSIDDMARLMTELLREEPYALMAMTADGPGFLTGSKASPSGLWELPYDGDTTWLAGWGSRNYGHISRGYHQEIAVFPGLDLAIVVLLDGDSDWPHFGPMAAELLRGHPYPRNHASTPPSDWGEYAGTYVDPIGTDGAPDTIVVTFDADTKTLGFVLEGGLGGEGVPCAAILRDGGFLEANTRFADLFCVQVAGANPALRFWRDDGADPSPTAISSLWGQAGPPFYRQ